MFTHCIGIGLALATIIGSAQAQERWYVYKDVAAPENHGFWTNYMPAPKDDLAGGADMIEIRLADATKPFGGPESGADNTGIRVKVNFDLQGKETPAWAGLAAASCRDCWGDVPPKTVYTDLVRATRLIFHARGDTGGEVVRVSLAITGDQPYGDSASIPPEKVIRLTEGWNSHSIDLQGANLSQAITPFAFFVERNMNQSDEVTFFFDEIYYEISSQ